MPLILEVVCYDNFKAAARLYRNRYPNRLHLNGSNSELHIKTLTRSNS